LYDKRKITRNRAGSTKEKKDLKNLNRLNKKMRNRRKVGCMNEDAKKKKNWPYKRRRLGRSRVRCMKKEDMKK
jgi:hypothetical protein